VAIGLKMKRLKMNIARIVGLISRIAIVRKINDIQIPS